ncbi:MAG: hypothetical protein WDZ28_05280 [Simkaniaceae bacterium]
MTAQVEKYFQVVNFLNTSPDPEDFYKIKKYNILANGVADAKEEMIGEFKKHIFSDKTIAKAKLLNIDNFENFRDRICEIFEEKIYKKMAIPA